MNIASYPDSPNPHTLIDVDIPPDNIPRLTFRYYANGISHTVMSAKLSVPFVIRFRQFAANAITTILLEYRASTSGPPKVTPGDRKLTFEYTAPAFVSDPDLTFDPIRVTLTLSAAANPVNHGWINCDLQHSYPKQIPVSSTEGWEETIHFPFLDFSEAGPGGFAPVITGPMNFAAVYTKTDTVQDVNTAAGIAIHLDDIHGHNAFAYYDPAHAQLNYTLRNSIHLHKGAFVRPDEYVMSAGDAFGFGGHRIAYRIRAFRLQSACKAAPVGWHDVMGLYRDWLRVRFGRPEETSLFYRKLPSIEARPKNAPVDRMAPLTVIANYGLDGAIDPKDGAQLCGWLETHPLRTRYLDTPNAAGNPSFEQLLAYLQSKFQARPKVEVQGWGIERAGFYQFICGYAPATSTISGDGSSFINGVRALGQMDAVFSVTTDPLYTLFNRMRFEGHIRFNSSNWADVGKAGSWVPYIAAEMPEIIRNARCAVTNVTIRGKQFKRVWAVEVIPDTTVPDSPHAVRLRMAQKIDEKGQPRQDPPSLGSGLHRASAKGICPTADVAKLYVDEWVQPWIIDQRVPVLEFMKQAPASYFCFAPGHQHIVAHDHLPPPADPRYDNVIGYGSWFARRIRCILYDVHNRGAVMDQDASSSFRVAHEFLPAEVMVPYINEYYRGIEEFDFVYSHLVTQHETPGIRGWGIHPGYGEMKQQGQPEGLISNAWMLDPERDDPYKSPQPPLRTDPIAMEDAAKREASFRLWRAVSIAHFSDHFAVREWGIAPRSYPTADMAGDIPWNPAKPLGETVPPTYTYNRCVQETFNLRANIFTTDAEAVRGVRIMIPSPWLEPPYDYTNDALEHAVLACRMQMEHASFFRFGRLLGETYVKILSDPPRNIWAWALQFRTFHDVKPLRDRIAADDDWLGKGWTSKPFRDFISLGWDKEFYDKDTYNEILITPMIHHRVWQSGDGETRKLLYAFANVSNTAAPVSFLYSRGLEGVTEATKWRRTIRFYTKSAIAPVSDFAWVGKWDLVTMPARSFAAAVVEK